MALINTTTTGVLGTTLFGDGQGALTVQKDGVTQGVYGNIPAFQVSCVGTFSMSANTWTKIQLNTKQFDTNNNFDITTNFSYTPTVAGYYQFNFANAQLLAGTSYLSLYKNGVAGLNQFGASASPSGSTIFYMNGTTDYVDLRAYNSQTMTNVTASVQYVFLSGFLFKAA